MCELNNADITTYKMIRTPAWVFKENITTESCIFENSEYVGTRRSDAATWCLTLRFVDIKFMFRKPSHERAAYQIQKSSDYFVQFAQDLQIEYSKTAPYAFFRCSVMVGLFTDWDSRYIGICKGIIHLRDVDDFEQVCRADMVSLQRPGGVYEFLTTFDEAPEYVPLTF